MEFLAESRIIKRLVLGKQADISQFPWQVSVHDSLEEEKFINLLCSGVIVGPNEVLTSGQWSD